MGGILHNYFIGRKLHWAVRIVIPLILCIFAVFSTEFTAMNLLVAFTLGVWVTMGINTRLRRFYTVMPISSKTFMFSEYLHNAVTYLIGFTIAIIAAIFRAPDTSAGIMYVLLALGIFFGFASTEQIAQYLPRYGLFVQFIVMFFLVGFIFILFGVDTVMQLIRTVATREPALEADIFANVRGMLIFAATNVCMYVLSFFPSLKLYRKADYVDMKWWMS